MADCCSTVIVSVEEGASTLISSGPEVVTNVIVTLAPAINVIVSTEIGKSELVFGVEAVNEVVTTVPPASIVETTDVTTSVIYLATGPAGPPGPIGLQGIQGIAGPVGPRGQDGSSAFNYAISFALMGA